MSLEFERHLEYPSYGVYKEASPDEKIICLDALLLYNFLTQTIGFKPENVIVIGRSMGSGPAVYLASQQKVKLLALISPYKSVKSVARDHYSFWGLFVKERFSNIERIKKIHQPVFFLHGLKVDLLGFGYQS